MRSPTRVAAVAAVGAWAFVGGWAIWSFGQSANPSPSRSTASLVPISSPSPTGSPSATRAATPLSSRLADVRGWPTTGRNPPGDYSWGGILPRCEPGKSCTYGFMHNGFGSGGVAISIRELPEMPDAAGATAVTVVGHGGWYRRLVEPEPSVDVDSLRDFEEWIVDFGGTAVAIRIHAKPGASRAELDEAHAIVDSMRYEPAPRKPGFMLVFTIRTGDWDSG